MKRSQCEREIEVASALRTGSWTAELNGHAQDCSICAEMRLVAESLLASAAALRVEQEPIAADRVWRRAQERKREMALKRATRPLIFMRAVSVVCMIAFAVWLQRSFWHFGDRLADAGRANGWHAMGAETASMGVAIAVACIAVGAWYLLHVGKRAEGTVSST